MAKLIASNCIFFLSSHYDNDNKNSLVSIISEFYLPEEIISTKTILIDECEKLGISNSIAKFKPTRQLTKGDGIQKVIRDIIDIWCVIDVQKGGKTISTYVVDDPKRLPAVDNNSQNFHHLFTLISHLQKQITDIGNIVTRIDKNTEVTNLDPTFATTISVFVSADSSMDTGARNSRYLIVKSQTEAELISIDVYPVKTKERGRFSP